MITIEKLKEYEAWEGNDDLYQRQGGFDKKIFEPREWSLIENLRSEAKLVVKNLASESFAKTINEKIIESCDGPETVEYLKKLAHEGW